MKERLFLFCLILVQTVFAQERLSIADIQKINSKSLNAEREIWVNLPESYNNSQLQKVDYPVIYVLDEESNFTFLTGVVNKFQNGHYPEIPESIIVGITNKNGDRTKDFTYQNDVNFLNFIQQELFPFMKDHYRINDFKLLIGHSLGGYFALKTLYNHPTVFNGYVAHDPSIWYNNKELLGLFQNLSTHQFNNRFLMITQVGQGQNVDHLREHYQSIKILDDRLRKANNQTFYYNYKQYNDEEHGSVPMIGSIDYLRWQFEGYRINIKEIPTQPQLINETFEAFSKRMNFPFSPTESYINLVANYLVKQNKLDLAKQFYEQNKTNFPQSKQATEALEKLRYK
mgnify:CR=1 FL=1